MKRIDIIEADTVVYKKKYSDAVFQSNQIKHGIMGWVKSKTCDGRIMVLYHGDLKRWLIEEDWKEEGQSRLVLGHCFTSSKGTLFADPNHHHLSWRFEGHGKRRSLVRSVGGEWEKVIRIAFISA